MIDKPINEWLADELLKDAEQYFKKAGYKNVNISSNYEIEGEYEVISKNLTLSLPPMNMDFTVVLNGDEAMDIVDSEQRSITKLTYAGEQATIEYNPNLLEHLPENDEPKLLEDKKP